MNLRLGVSLSCPSHRLHPGEAFGLVELGDEPLMSLRRAVTLRDGKGAGGDKLTEQQIQG